MAENKLLKENNNLQTDLDKKSVEINKISSTNQKLEHELFYGLNVTLKEKENVINYLKDKLSMTETQVINFLSELNYVHSNLKGISINYESHIDNIIRQNTNDSRDKDILINDLNNRIF